jgi:hypothetical protein
VLVERLLVDEVAKHEPGSLIREGQEVGNLGVNVMITFWRFSPIFEEENGVFLENQCYDTF